MKDALQQLIMMSVRARWIMKEYIYDSDQQKDDTSEKILFVFIFMPGKTG